MTHWAASYGDTKILIARRMLKAGATAKEMAPALGYKTAKGVQKYLRAVGLPLPFIKDKSGNRKPRSDAEKQAQAERMREFHRKRQGEYA